MLLKLAQSKPSTVFTSIHQVIAYSVCHFFEDSAHFIWTFLEQDRKSLSSIFLDWISYPVKSFHDDHETHDLLNSNIFTPFWPPSQSLSTSAWRNLKEGYFSHSCLGERPCLGWTWIWIWRVDSESPHINRRKPMLSWALVVNTIHVAVAYVGPARARRCRTRSHAMTVWVPYTNRRENKNRGP